MFTTVYEDSHDMFRAMASRILLGVDQKAEASRRRLEWRNIL